LRSNFNIMGTSKNGDFHRICASLICDFTIRGLGYDGTVQLF